MASIVKKMERLIWPGDEEAREKKGLIKEIIKEEEIALHKWRQEVAGPYLKKALASADEHRGFFCVIDYDRERRRWCVQIFTMNACFQPEAVSREVMDWARTSLPPQLETRVEFLTVPKDRRSVSECM